MKNIILLIITACLCIVTSCSGSKNVLFSSEKWSYSNHSKNMINSDSTYQFCFEDNITPEMTIISNYDSLSLYPGADKYINQVLGICGLQDSKVYFYIPAKKIMWVELPQNYYDIKPRSITCNLQDSTPYTYWVWDDDIYDGNRTPDIIYSNTFSDKKRKTIIVVDKLTYGDKSLACLHIYQSATKQTDKLNFFPWYWSTPGNLLNHSYADILANWVDSRRTNLINNYKLGLSVDYRREINSIKTELKEILQKDQEPRNRIVAAWQEHPNDTMLHKNIARDILTNDSINLIRVCEILENYSLDFGEENEVVWAVIQHSNIELQNKYLPKFIEAAKKGVIKKELIAVMQDRIACQSGKPQIYGSQGNFDTCGNFIPAEINDPENVDIRRAEMGMCPLKEYIDQMSRH